MKTNKSIDRNKLKGEFDLTHRPPRTEVSDLIRQFFKAHHFFELPDEHVFHFSDNQSAEVFEKTNRIWIEHIRSTIHYRIEDKDEVLTNAKQDYYLAMMKNLKTSIETGQIELTSFDVYQKGDLAEKKKNTVQRIVFITIVIALFFALFSSNLSTEAQGTIFFFSIIIVILIGVITDYKKN